MGNFEWSGSETGSLYPADLADIESSSAIAAFHVKIVSNEWMLQAVFMLHQQVGNGLASRMLRPLQVHQMTCRIVSTAWKVWSCP
jgi:hypothetical protein